MSETGNQGPGRHPDWSSWLIDHLGQPLPCALCDRLYPAADLVEAVLPAGVVEFDLPGGGPSFVLQESVWVCRRCYPNNPASGP